MYSFMAYFFLFFLVSQFEKILKSRWNSVHLFIFFCSKSPKETIDQLGTYVMFTLKMNLEHMTKIS